MKKIIKLIMIMGLLRVLMNHKFISGVYKYIYVYYKIF